MDQISRCVDVEGWRVQKVGNDWLLYSNDNGAFVKAFHSWFKMIDYIDSVKGKKQCI